MVLLERTAAVNFALSVVQSVAAMYVRKSLGGDISMQAYTSEFTVSTNLL